MPTTPCPACGRSPRASRPTSRAAAQSVTGFAPRLRVTVLAWIRAAGRQGTTGKEAGSKYAVGRGKHPDDGSCRYTIMPRISELHASGFVRDSGMVRDKAAVWVATAKRGDGSNCRRRGAGGGR